MLISTALLLDSIIRNSVCTPAKLPCCRVEVGYEKHNYITFLFYNTKISDNIAESGKVPRMLAAFPR
jgi:type VI protein secretion system component Hcp